MSLLKDFLIENANVSEEEHEVIVSARFKDKEGNTLKFKVKPVTSDKFSEYQTKCSNLQIEGKKKVMKLDGGKFNNMIIVNHCVDPNFRDAELLKSINVQTPEQAVAKLLLAGEVLELAQQISSISGFDQDINEDIEEAKN